MIEDVLVKVDKFIFPAYFIVLDMEEDKEIPIILGRPLLETGRAMIDVQRGELKLRVQEDDVTPQTFFLNDFFSWNLSFRCFMVYHKFIIIFRNYF